MDPLDRLYWRLVEVLRREGPEIAGRTVTVAEIYQRLVPYRLHRSELGLAELAEYEHALLRLLSGERGYVRLDLAQVQEEFARELRAPNPILGLYRDYAAVGVQFGGAPPAPAPRPAPVQDVSPSAPPPVVERPARSASARPTACRHCREPLPADREVKFCPFCGTHQRPTPCAECGAAVEPEWKFCAECGATRPLSPGEQKPVSTR